MAGETADAGPISLIVLDIDGVLTEGESSRLDLDFLGRLAAMNETARRDGGRPPITLCTGRPAPYLELMLQAIDGHLPGIFENGAGLYFPRSYRFTPHPALAGQNHIRQVRQRLHESLVQSGQVYFQPGKEYTLTLFATDPGATDQLKEMSQAALGPLSEGVDLVYSTSCLNILPRSIDKGKGLDFLSQEAGVAVQAMLGVGDSDVDIPFLQKSGHSAAPANAMPTVKAVVDYVSPERTSEAVLDILKEYELLP